VLVWVYVDPFLLHMTTTAFNLSMEINRLIQEDYEWILRDNPEYASQVGQHQYDHLLQDVSPAAFELRIEHNQRILDQINLLKAQDDEQQQDGQQAMANHEEQTITARLHLELFSKDLLAEMEALKYGCHLYPLNSIGYGGVHNNFIEALDWLGETNREENFLSRFSSFPSQANQWKELLREGIKQNKVASVSMVRKVSQQFEKILTDLQNNVGPISTHLQAAVSGVEEGIEQPGIPPSSEKIQRIEVAKTNFMNSLSDLKEFIVREYIPSARPQDGATGLSSGQEIYNLCLKYHTTTILTAEEIHTIGLNEVNRIEERYKNEVMVPLGHEEEDSSVESFVSKYKDPNCGQYYHRAGDLLEGYRILTAHIQTKLPKYFEIFPKSEMEIVSLETSTAPAAYYMQGTSDGKRPGRFYVNVSNLTQRPIYEMTALALHEGIPGHHFQGSLAIENPSIPSFLRFVEDRRYEYCPARRQLYAAYLEGWALYCEALGEEMGMYATPLNLFGRLSMEMMRAVRLVVDTGIHYKGWSVEEAIAYMMSKTGMHRHEVEAECYRYEAWPGQACESMNQSLTEHSEHTHLYPFQVPTRLVKLPSGE
jgi:uncharacterized protein (DUF885 family)